MKKGITIFYDEHRESQPKLKFDRDLLAEPIEVRKEIFLDIAIRLIIAYRICRQEMLEGKNENREKQAKDVIRGGPDFRERKET